MINKPAILLILAMLNLAAYAQQTYQLDIKKSKILWDARKSMGGHYGYLLFNSGTLNYSAGGEPVDGVFSLNMNTLSSTDDASPEGNQKVDKELRTTGFFNVAQYPEAIMTVKRITAAGNAATFSVTGTLTIKGITNPITFTATINKKENTITATANLKMDRIKWHIDHQPKRQAWDMLSVIKDKMIADEIGIKLNLVFTK